MASGGPRPWPRCSRSSAVSPSSPVEEKSGPITENEDYTVRSGKHRATRWGGGGRSRPWSLLASGYQALDKGDSDAPFQKALQTPVSYIWHGSGICLQEGAAGPRDALWAHPQITDVLPVTPTTVLPTAGTVVCAYVLLTIKKQTEGRFVFKTTTNGKPREHICSLRIRSWWHGRAGDGKGQDRGDGAVRLGEVGRPVFEAR